MAVLVTAGSALGNLGEYHGVPLPSVSSIYPLRPRGYCTGLMVRNSTSKEFFAPNIGSFVHEIKWNEWQPVSAATLDGSKVAAALDVLDWAEANGKRVRLRIFAGIYTPGWALTASGSMNWYEYSQTAGETFRGAIPKWWGSAYRAVYNAWTDKLVTALGDHPALYEVTNSQCSTVFAEPMNRQWGSGTNVATAHTNGYTIAADIQAMKNAFVDHQRWAEVGVATYSAFNPWQEPKNIDTDQTGGVKPVPATTYELFDAFRRSLGRSGVFGNNSIGNPITVRGPRYSDMWNYMGALALADYPFRQPLGFQTMNASVMTSFGSTAYGTADMVEEMGALSVEMPEGWLTNPAILMTPEQAADLNERFAENTALVEEI